MRPRLALTERIQAGPPVLLDGALGTQLELRGQSTPPPLWSAGPLLRAPDSVLGVHQDYVLAGAEVLLACTFRTHPRAVAGADPGLDARKLTARAVALAREAADGSARPVWVAGSVAPVEDCFRPDLVPPGEVLEREHRAHAENLRDAGVDVVFVETMNSATEARIALQASRELGLAAGVCFALEDPGHLRGGFPLAEAVEELLFLEPLFVGINCTPADVALEGLNRLSGCWDGPWAVYPNFGARQGRTWKPGGGKPEQLRFREHLRACVRAGARLIGGCCGTTPTMIAALGRDREPRVAAAEGGAS